jgi:hypothetical protein
MIVIVRILSWLKARSLPYSKWRPILIKKEFAWMADIPRVIRSCGDAQTIFDLSSAKLDLSPSLTAAEREALLNFVDVHYRPALRVHFKPVDLEAWNSTPGSTPVRRRIADAIAQVGSSSPACRWVGKALENLATEVSVSEACIGKHEFLESYANIKSELRWPGAHEFDFEALRRRVEEADEIQVLVSHIWSTNQHAVVVRSESSGRVIGCAVLLAMPVPGDGVPSDLSEASGGAKPGEEEA